MAFELRCIEMYVISTVKDREEVLQRKVCESTQRKRNTGHSGKPVIRRILPGHMGCKSGKEEGRTGLSFARNLKKTFTTLDLTLLGALLYADLRSGTCPQKTQKSIFSLPFL